jgi:hypothetical protein
MIYIPDKFNYTSLSRIESDGTRKYLTPDGQKLPSVTTILSATKPRESIQKLNEWKNRVGHKKAQEITTEASGRGTRVHKFLEDYIKSGTLPPPGSNPYSIQGHRMAQEIVFKGLSDCDEFWGTEVNLHFPSVYAGTTDLVGVHDGSPAIMDFKQSNKLKKREWIEDYFLQLVSYAECHNEIYGTDIKKGVVFMCTADFEYQEFILEGTEWSSTVNKWWHRVEEYYQKF